MITLITAAVLGITLAGVLSHSSFHSMATVRSTHWNKALVIAEGGVEEALAQLNASTNGLSANGWTLSSEIYSKQRSIESDWYEVYISADFNAPVITSKASVVLPLTTNRVERTIRVAVAKQATGMRGMVAKGKVVMGGDARTDSYDSSNPAYSTDGMYDPVKARDHGDVSSVSTEANDVELSGDAKVNGRLSVGHLSVVKMDPLASVGSFSWTTNAANAGRIETNYLTMDFALSITNVVVPSTAGAFSVSGGNYGGTNYAVLLSGNSTYTTSTLALSAGQTMLVTGDTTLIIADTLDVTGTAKIIIAPSARLTMYVGKSAVIGGAGIANLGGKPRDFMLYGSPDCAQIYYSGTGNLIGTVYAPSAKMDLTGASHFMGASVSAEIVLGNTMQFHYDESLGKNQQAYTVASWSEL